MAPHQKYLMQILRYVNIASTEFEVHEHLVRKGHMAFS